MSGRAPSGGRGFTLLEVMVSIGIIALMTALVYSAMYGMSSSRRNMVEVGDRYHQGRAALGRMSRELGSAFISTHQPFSSLQPPRQTAFIGTDGSPDRVDFNSFSHRRLERDSHESDQNELSYFVASDPDEDKLDLVRREAVYLDDDPEHGGVVQVLAEDVEQFDLEYLDPLTGEWLTSWDSMQPAAQLGRLPAQVRISLVLRGGPTGTIRFETKTPIAIQLPLDFATAAR